MVIFHGIVSMRNALFDSTRTIEVGPEQGHYGPPILALVDTFNPIPIMGIGNRLFDYPENLPTVLGVD